MFRILRLPLSLFPVSDKSKGIPKDIPRFKHVQNSTSLFGEDFLIGIGCSQWSVGNFNDNYDGFITGD